MGINYTFIFITLQLKLSIFFHYECRQHITVILSAPVAWSLETSRYLHITELQLSPSFVYVRHYFKFHQLLDLLYGGLPNDSKKEDRDYCIKSLFLKST